jgi:predicted transcriptional regulator
VNECSLPHQERNSANPGGDAVSGMKTTSLAAFASQLRAWRQQMGWTQVEAADKLGYSASLVSGIETMDKTAR